MMKKAEENTCRGAKGSLSVQLETQDISSSEETEGLFLPEMHPSDSANKLEDGNMPHRCHSSFEEEDRTPPRVHDDVVNSSEKVEGGTLLQTHDRSCTSEIKSDISTESHETSNKEVGGVTLPEKDDADLDAKEGRIMFESAETNFAEEVELSVELGLNHISSIHKIECSIRPETCDQNSVKQGTDPIMPSVDDTHCTVTFKRLVHSQTQLTSPADNRGGLIPAEMCESSAKVKVMNLPETNHESSNEDIQGQAQQNLEANWEVEKLIDSSQSEISPSKGMDSELINYAPPMDALQCLEQRGLPISSTDRKECTSDVLLSDKPKSESICPAKDGSVGMEGMISDHSFSCEVESFAVDANTCSSDITDFTSDGPHSSMGAVSESLEGAAELKSFEGDSSGVTLESPYSSSEVAGESMESITEWKSFSAISDNNKDYPSSVEVHSDSMEELSARVQDSTRLRSKRIDLGHQLVREIVKIQHDREHYERQMQTSKQENQDHRKLEKVDWVGKTTPKQVTGNKFSPRQTAVNGLNGLSVQAAGEAERNSVQKSELVSKTDDVSRNFSKAGVRTSKFFDTAESVDRRNQQFRRALPKNGSSEIKVKILSNERFGFGNAQVASKGYLQIDDSLSVQTGRESGYEQTMEEDRQGKLLHDRQLPGRTGRQKEANQGPRSNIQYVQSAIAGDSSSWQSGTDSSYKETFEGGRQGRFPYDRQSLGRTGNQKEAITGQRSNILYVQSARAGDFASLQTGRDSSYGQLMEGGRQGRLSNDWQPPGRTANQKEAIPGQHSNMQHVQSAKVGDTSSLQTSRDSSYGQTMEGGRQGMLSNDRQMPGRAGNQKEATQGWGSNIQHVQSAIAGDSSSLQTGRDSSYIETMEEGRQGRLLYDRQMPGRTGNQKDAIQGHRSSIQRMQSAIAGETLNQGRVSSLTREAFHSPDQAVRRDGQGNRYMSKKDPPFDNREEKFIGSRSEDQLERGHVFHQPIVHNSSPQEQSLSGPWVPYRDQTMGSSRTRNNANLYFDELEAEVGFLDNFRPSAGASNSSSSNSTFQGRVSVESYHSKPLRSRWEDVGSEDIDSQSAAFSAEEKRNIRAETLRPVTSDPPLRWAGTQQDEPSSGMPFMGNGKDKAHFSQIRKQGAVEVSDPVVNDDARKQRRQVGQWNANQKGDGPEISRDFSRAPFGDWPLDPRYSPSQKFGYHQSDKQIEVNNLTGRIHNMDLASSGSSASSEKHFSYSSPRERVRGGLLRSKEGRQHAKKSRRNTHGILNRDTLFEGPSSVQSETSDSLAVKPISGSGSRGGDDSANKIDLDSPHTDSGNVTYDAFEASWSSATFPANSLPNVKSSEGVPNKSSRWGDVVEENEEMEFSPLEKKDDPVWERQGSADYGRRTNVTTSSLPNRSQQPNNFAKRVHQVESTMAATKAAPNSASVSGQGTPARKSVWERLGPCEAPAEVLYSTEYAGDGKFRRPSYKTSYSDHSFNDKMGDTRQMEHDQEVYSGSSGYMLDEAVSTVQAYKNEKLKRGKLELYVPRRGSHRS